MSWQDLLASEERVVLPWVGGRKLYGKDRSWSLKGKLPEEHGWYEFEISGNRRASLVGPADPDPDFETGRSCVRGYLAGNRLVPDHVRVDPDPTRLVDQTLSVHLVEPGLERFARAITAFQQDGTSIFVRQEFPEGPEVEVQEAYQDRLESVAHIKGVTPALDLTFRWMSRQRLLAEEREREAERRRIEEEKKRAEQELIRQAMKDSGTGLGRRVLAQRDFKAAAKAALAVSGAQLLDARKSYRGNEMVVQYRFRNQRLECVVDKNTLRIIDAGVCLDDHHGTKGDTFFTLESLPAVIGEAMDLGVLVVWRHAN
jgi:hypothetical protein